MVGSLFSFAGPVDFPAVVVCVSVRVVAILDRSRALQRKEPERAWQKISGGLVSSHQIEGKCGRGVGGSCGGGGGGFNWNKSSFSQPWVPEGVFLCTNCEVCRLWHQRSSKGEKI